MRELCPACYIYLVTPDIVIHRATIYIMNVRLGYLGSVLLCVTMYFLADLALLEKHVAQIFAKTQGPACPVNATQLDR